MITKILPSNQETSYLVSRLLYEDHIYKAVDDRIHDVWYAHKFLSDIEHGLILVFGVFRKSDDLFLGCSTGEIIGTDIIVHALFKRGTDVVKAAFLIEEEIRKLGIKTIIGTIPEYNRAALMMAKRAGYKDHGFAENITHYKVGETIRCRSMRKEI